MDMSQILKRWVEGIISVWKLTTPRVRFSTGNQYSLFRDLAEELYFRANNAKTVSERKAIKGVQHAIEDVLEKHGIKSFDRPDPNSSWKKTAKSWYKENGK